MSRAPATILLLAVGVLLGGCPGHEAAQVVAKNRLPPAPADIVRCFRQGGATIPDQDLTIAEVERLWKSDRLRAAVMQRCGKRFVAWYADLQAQWD
jgi:hypothetical protein